jgi:hypothetical protein
MISHNINTRPVTYLDWYRHFNKKYKRSLISHNMNTRLVTYLDWYGHFNKKYKRSLISQNMNTRLVTYLDWYRHFNKKRWVQNVQFLNNVLIIKTHQYHMLPSSGIGNCGRFWLVVPFGYVALKYIKIIWLSNLSILGVPHEGYSKNASYGLNLISTCLLLSLGWYHCWWTSISPGYHPLSNQCFGMDMVY